MKNILKIGWISFCVIFLDLFSKHIAQKYLVSWDIDLFFWMKFSLVFNEWIAFSLPVTGVIQIILSLVLLWFLVFYAKKHWDLSFFLIQIPLGLIIWWAIWNLYERVLFSQVTDFISVFSWFPIFNLADSFIFIWAVLILLFESKMWKKMPD